MKKKSEIDDNIQKMVEKYKTYDENIEEKY